MEFKELWTLVEYFCKNNIKTCCFENCEAPIQDIYHLWTNATDIHVRLKCAKNHYDWHSIKIRGLYARYNHKLQQVEVGEVKEYATISV